MVHVTKRQGRVQRCIDGGRDDVLCRKCRVIKLHHFVFASNTAIPAHEANKLVQVNRCKAFAPNASEVAAAPSYPQNFRGNTADGIGLDDFKLMFPPRTFVMRKSAPKRFERYDNIGQNLVLSITPSRS